MLSMSCLFVWFSILTNVAHYKLMLMKSKHLPTALYISTYFTILFLVHVVDLYLQYLDVCGLMFPPTEIILEYDMHWWKQYFHFSSFKISTYIIILIIILQAWQKKSLTLLKVNNNNVLSKKTCFHKLDNNAA